MLYHTIPATSCGLLQTLAGSKYLSSLVKAIDLTPLCTSSDALISAFKIAERRDGLNISPIIRKRLNHDLYFPAGTARWYNAHALLHLAMLPNLETILYVCSKYRVDKRVAHYIRQYEPALPRLREIRLVHDNIPTNSSRFPWIIAMLTPRIERVYGCSIGWNLPLVRLQPPEQFALQHVELVDTSINHLELDDMLSRCPDLRTLRIAWGIGSQTTKDPLELNLLGDVLRKHKPKLTELALDPKEDDCLTPYLFSHPIGSLRELKWLKKLVVPFDVLVREK
ncbi:hypothetical protein F4810DRAFT_662042 [Camillea tinctor]|nr:hypothetical protein F4810DRAFT_662042 [Camillea tinctor]